MRAARLGLALLAVAALAAPAAGYEAETTLAGLTQQAALGSRLHQVLSDRFGRSQGLFDPLRLRLDLLEPRAARRLRAQLLRLDPAEGYAPEDLSQATTTASGTVPPEAGSQGSRALRAPERQPALGWLLAGTVLESLPTSRVRNHFLAGGRPGDVGLYPREDEGRAATALTAVARGLATSRELMAGAAFDGTGMAATAWINQPEAQNPLSLLAYRRHYREAVLAATEPQREGELAQALLAAGAVLSVLGQMGDPAQVRNDPDALVGAGSYPLYVAQRYARAGVPAPQPEKALPRLRELTQLTQLFHSLADRTAMRFFSPGSLPGTVRAQEAPRPDGVTEALTLGPSPTLPEGRAEETRVPLGWPQAPSGYLGDASVRYRVRWQRLPAEAGLPPRLRWSLDERCLAEQAALLLPEIGRYEVAALDLLLGKDLKLRKADGALQVAFEGPLKQGRITVLAEDKDGRRQVRDAQAARLGEPVLYQGAVPTGAVRVAVLLEGTDDAGEPVLTSATLGVE